MSLLERIFATPELTAEPPVLVDVGASGAIHPKWKPFAKHAICVAFDPDKRDMDAVETASADYRKLYVLSCIATAERDGESDFFLTASPYCSSTLEPHAEGLRDWCFSGLFAVERKVKLRARTLASVLAELQLPRVDWFKTDSQGTDLRLFLNLGSDRANRVLVAEFEPGFIDAYRGEDKIADLLREMDKRPFWLADFEVRGNQRIPAAIREEFLSHCRERFLEAYQKPSPGWAGITYLNNFQQLRGKRELFLGYAFALVEEQHAFAYFLADAGVREHGDALFTEMKEEIAARMRNNHLSVSAVIARKAARKIAGLIG